VLIKHDDQISKKGSADLIKEVMEQMEQATMFGEAAHVKVKAILIEL